MCKANFCFVTQLGNFKDNVCARPLGLVLNKVKIVLQNVPHDFLARHAFGDLESGTVHVLVVVIKYDTKLVSVTFNGL